MPVDDGCTETPQCAALRIFRPNFFSKRPFVVHEVMETTVRQLRELQKAQVFRDQRQNGFVGELMVVQQHDDERPCNIVGRVTAAAIGDTIDRMLNYTGVVSQANEVIQLDLRQARRGAERRLPYHGATNGTHGNMVEDVQIAAGPPPPGHNTAILLKAVSDLMPPRHPFAQIVECFSYDPS